MEEIKKEYLAKTAKKYQKDDKNVIIRHALSNNSLYTLSSDVRRKVLGEKLGSSGLPG